ncbi:MAG: hypothetical protein ACFCVE_12580 [Phycisphaerae bacterium]
METSRYLEELDRPAKVQTQFSHVLASWGTISSLAGAGLFAVGQGGGRTFMRGLGLQMAGWGVANVLIAALGLKDAAGARPVQGPARRRRLVRLLNVNIGLDTLYLVTAGLLFLIGRSRRDDKAAGGLFGHALGVATQGAFLLGFDRAFRKALGRA